MNNYYLDARKKLVDDINKGIFPYTAAYHYYVNTKKGSLLNPNDFCELLQSGISSRYNWISLSEEDPEMDGDKVIGILEKYYGVSSLFDKDGNFIKFV